MFRELEQLRQSIVEFASRFDAGGLTPSSASTAVRMLSQMDASIASMKALAAAKAAESEAWKQSGFRSAADELASQTGVGVGRARQLLESGRRMAVQPEVAAAALAGELSSDQAALVSDGAAAAPGRARELVEKARQVSIGELTDEVARVKAAATDLEARRAAIQAGRSWRSRKTVDGAWRGFVYGHPEDGALWYRVLTPLRRRLTILAREAGRREPVEAIDYDSLMTLARLALGEKADIDVAELLELGLFPQLAVDAPPVPPGPSGPPSLFEPDPDAGGGGPVDPSAAGEPGGVGGPGEPGEPGGREGGAGGPGAAGGPDCGGGPGGLSAAGTAGEGGAPVPGEPEGAAVGAAGGGKPGRKRRPKRLAGSPAKVIALVDLDTLLRGAPVEGERCEILGFGPVAVSVIEGLLASGNTQLAWALMHNKQVIGVHHARRRPNAHQTTALEAMYPDCAVVGCNSRAGLQQDHRVDWADTHFTVLDLMDSLCPFHHRLKTQKNWGLVEGMGKREFVPPDHPRHTRHTGRPRPGPDPPATGPP